MPFHEFGIIEDFNIRKDYSYYSPEEYSCISVDDDLIQNFSESLKMMKSYFHSYERLGFGLAYCGVTIIPPESLTLFYEVIVSSPSFKESSNLTDLAAKVSKSNEEKRYMIHFGI
ncbi:hypothetical protein FIU87_11210 [Bacillus sp. THAF10]|uniref:short-chain dehydrogenase n=1 Tax=Bacillus sp. THAF10 TaxID=2587848 RepID=UPI0012685754|nr:short-chain dehydrogenase [Bacillus sp. THAF10]QFT89217.1 hypothetical protein FIU87_11210 [Bacillus sp. THAF10]